MREYIKSIRKSLNNFPRYKLLEMEVSNRRRNPVILKEIDLFYSVSFSVGIPDEVDIAIEKTNVVIQQRPWNV